MSTATPSVVAPDAPSVVVYVTAPPAAAPAIARHVVTARLAACVNVLPGLTSVYRWEGAVEEDPESLLMIKTTRTRLEALYAAVKSVHPAQVPEFIALPVEAGSAPYLRWLRESVAEEPVAAAGGEGEKQAQ